MGKVTVCVKCIHCSTYGMDRPWYEYRCGAANVIKSEYSSVTGTIKKWEPYCRDINDDNCINYEEHDINFWALAEKDPDNDEEG